MTYAWELSLFFIYLSFFMFSFRIQIEYVHFSNIFLSFRFKVAGAVYMYYCLSIICIVYAGFYKIVPFFFFFFFFLLYFLLFIGIKNKIIHCIKLGNYDKGWEILPKFTKHSSKRKSMPTTWNLVEEPE